MYRSGSWLSVAAAAGLLLGCNSGDKSPTSPALLSANLVQSQVSGAVLGPDGTSICNFLAPGSVVTVRSVPLATNTIIGPSQNVACPGNTYSVPIDTGSYRMRVTLPVSAALPWRWLEPGAITGDGNPITKNLTVQNGLALGGGATLDGAPLAGIPLTLTYGVNPAFAAAIGQTGASGTWEDNLGRAVLPLQVNEQYAPIFQCNGLGVTVSQFSPTVPFLYPSEAASADCQLQTASATQFTNSGARMVATAFPGDIGGQSGALLSSLGSGWGVQFPVAGGPVHFPFTATQLFLGGLIIGTGSGHILTGFNAAGELVCRVCQDLGTSGSVGIDQDPSGVRFIRWRYDDAGSSEGTGISVTQHSFDNPGGADYLLIRYAITNTGASRQTIYAGFFGDWDIDGAAFDDIGNTAMSGRLMYETNDGDLGTHAGTLVAGAPVAGHYFTDLLTPVTEGEQLRALSGAVQVPSSIAADIRYIQSVGPFTLAPGATRVIWVALVMGDDTAQLLANAAAASADIAARSGPAPDLMTAESRYAGGQNSALVRAAGPRKASQLQ